MGSILLVTSGKGGTGKSTVAVNLALSLVYQGKTALLVELDSGLRCLDLMLGIDSIVYDLGDVLSGKCQALDAVYSAENHKGLDIIAAPSDTNQIISPNRFQTLCKYLGRLYDFVILDTPAGLGTPLSLASEVSDLAIIVANTSQVSIRDAEKTATLLTQKGVKRLRLVVNMVPMEKEKNILIPDFDEIIDRVGAQLLAIIPDDLVLRKSIVERKNKDSKKSLGIKAFSNMAKRILGKDISLMLK